MKLKKDNILTIRFFVCLLFHLIAIVYNIPILHIPAVVMMIIDIYKSDIYALTARMFGLSFVFFICTFPGGITVFFIYSLLSCIKYISIKKVKINKVPLLIILLFIIQQVTLCFDYNSLKLIILWFLGLSYFFLLILDKNIEYSSKLTIKYILCSYIIITVGNFITGFNMYGLEYINILLSGSGSMFTIYRFGETFREVGGSNFYPIITLMLILGLFNELLKEKRKNHIIIYSIIIILATILGILTFTRAYIITLIFLLSILCVQVVSKHRKKVLAIIVGVICSIVIIGYLYSDKVTVILFSMVERFSGFSDLGGRSEIYLHYFDIIMNDVGLLFFGSGIKGYIDKFEHMAHNIWIDGILSFGLIGLSMIIFIFVWTSIKLKRSLRVRYTIFSWMPIIALSIEYLTTGSFTYEMTYFILLYAVFTLNYGYTFNDNRIHKKHKYLHFE